MTCTNHRFARLRLARLLLLILLVALLSWPALAAPRAAPLATDQQIAAIRGSDLLLSAGPTSAVYLPWIIR